MPQLSATHLRSIMKPIVRLFLRNAQSFQVFQSIAKALFVEISLEELSRRTHKVNVSRICAHTGINRQEISRILEALENHSPPPESFIQKIISVWQHDPEFCTRENRARVISADGAGSEFERLVYKVSQHLNAGTVLFIMVSRGLAEKTARGLKLNTAVFFNSGDPEAIAEQLAYDFEALAQVAEENLATSPGPCHHLQTRYDNVRADQLDNIRAWFHVEGRKLHKRARVFLSKFDADLNPPSEGTVASRGVVILGSYGWTSLGGDQGPRKEMTLPDKDVTL